MILWICTSSVWVVSCYTDSSEWWVVGLEPSTRIETKGLCQTFFEGRNIEKGQRLNWILWYTLYIERSVGRLNTTKEYRCQNSRKWKRRDFGGILASVSQNAKIVKEKKIRKAFGFDSKDIIVDFLIITNSWQWVLVEKHRERKVNKGNKEVLEGDVGRV